MKTCSQCKTEKPVDAFSRRKRSKDGFTSYCKECDMAYQRKRYAADRATRERKKLRNALDYQRRKKQAV